MVKIIVDTENKKFDIIELTKHSLDLDEIKNDIQKLVESLKTKEDVYTELGYWQFSLPDDIQEQIIVDVKEAQDE